MTSRNSTAKENPIERMARWLANHWNAGPGDLAELRKLQPESRLSGTYHRLAMYSGLPDTQETAFMIRCFAIGTKSGEKRNSTPHDPSMSLGKALNGANYTETRLKTMLNARGKTKDKMVEQMCRRLHQAGIKVDWREIRRVLRDKTSANDRAYDEVRTKVARDFYQARQPQRGRR